VGGGIKGDLSEPDCGAGKKLGAAPPVGEGSVAMELSRSAFRVTRAPLKSATLTKKVQMEWPTKYDGVKKV